MKVIVIGPVKSGKTLVSNHLANLTSYPSEYMPTAGVRILEVDDTPAAVQVWDCSGDLKYDSCWTCITDNAEKLILVVNADATEQVAQVENYLQWFRSSAIQPKDCLLVLLHSNPNNNINKLPANVTKGMNIVNAQHTSLHPVFYSLLFI